MAVLGNSSSDSNGPPLRLGVLGAADIAARRVLPAVRDTGGIDLVAVASRTPGKAETLAAAFGCDAVTGYDVLLDRADIDAVYLPLPPGLHAQWIERALLSGKHVLVEKPLTTSAEDTTRLVGLAERERLVLMENYMFVRHGQHAAVRELIADGAVGEPHLFTATFEIPRRPPGDIRYLAELGGGALLDTGGYPVRAAQLFFGPDLVVAGAYLRHDSALGVDIGGAAMLTGDGVVAQLSFGLSHEYLSRYEFHGSHGRLVLEHVFTTPADHAPVVRLVRGGVDEPRTLPAQDQVASAVDAFAAAVRRGHAPDSQAVVTQAALIDRIRSLASILETEPARRP
jgi:predicted dehydrogenase